MSDENKTDNPYQPPAPSVEPLAKQDADAPKAKLHPVHWLVPILGYAYVPAIFILGYLPRYTLSQGQSGMANKPHNQVWVVDSITIATLTIATLIYVFILIRLERRRNEQGTNTRANKLYSDLSWILPLLLVFLLRFF